MSPLLLVGAGGHAHACIDVIEQAGGYAITGVVGCPKEVGQNVLGYPVIGSDPGLAALKAACPNALVTVGQIKSPDLRIRLFDLLVGLGFNLPIIVSPLAHVSRHASLGAGSIVMHGAIINAGARIGNNCIINSQALVEHDVRIAEHCHISTGTRVNGGAVVGTGSFIGSGSILREGIQLGERCVVGMGLAVRNNQPAHTWILQ